MTKLIPQDEVTPEDEDPQFDVSPEEATKMDGSVQPKKLNRKKLLIVLCISFAVVVCGGMLFSTFNTSNKRTSSGEHGLTAPHSSQNEFLTSLRNRAVVNMASDIESPELPGENTQEIPQPLLPPVSLRSQPEQNIAPPPVPSVPSPAPQPPRQNQQRPTHYSSPLVPQIQGSLFNGSQPLRLQQQTPANNNNHAFNNSPAAVNAVSGHFIADNSIWPGTVVPGILQTAINTDFPGNVLARVAQNVYDSRTGRSLLIPQGTILLARYNSSVSYAQSRVQIIWDTLIRPDGFIVNLQEAIGIDSAGMSGLPAQYHENWFEYLKAAGLIALFSVANARMTETAAEHASEETAGIIAASSAQSVNTIGESIIGRAMNITPTLTVDNGSKINIMINTVLYLPVLDNFHVNHRYILE